MPDFHVEKSIEINAAPDKVYKIVSDFSNWTVWSPWSVLEPDAKVTVTANGKEYAWEGRRTGWGNMKMLKESPVQRLDLVVNFIKPWKSTSPVWFELKPAGNSTLVTWGMKGSLPFFLFFMTKTMTAYLGMDYMRGLMMLKDFVETGRVPSSLQFKGITSYSGCNYVGIQTTCTIETVGPKMRADFETLGVWAKSHSSIIHGMSFSIYHTWDPVKNKVVYTAAVPVKEIPKDLPAGGITGSVPTVRVNTIAHKGAYRHLGNAWSAQQSMQQSKEYKSKKGVAPFEVYVNMPGAVPEDELITEVYHPVL